MALEKSTRLALIICGTLLLLGLAAISWGSGRQIDFGDALTALIGVAGYLFGVAHAGGSGGPRASHLLALLFVAAAPSWGCGRCVVERGVVDALAAAVPAAEAAAGYSAEEEEVSIALDATRGAVHLGQAAVDGCEALRDGEGWQAWLQIALGVARDLAAILAPRISSRSEHYDALGSSADSAREWLEPVGLPPELSHAIAELDAALGAAGR